MLSKETFSLPPGLAFSDKNVCPLLQSEENSSFFTFMHFHLNIRTSYGNLILFHTKIKFVDNSTHCSFTNTSNFCNLFDSILPIHILYSLPYLEVVTSFKGF